MATKNERVTGKGSLGDSDSANIPRQAEDPPIFRDQRNVKFDQFSWDNWVHNSLPAQYWNLMYLALGALQYSFWPNLADCKTLEWGWCFGVIARNLVTMQLFYGFTHWYLYEARSGQEELKFNARWPPESQHRRDQFLTTLSFLISSAYEVRLPPPPVIYVYVCHTKSAVHSRRRRCEVLGCCLCLYSTQRAHTCTHASTQPPPPH